MSNATHAETKEPVMVVAQDGDVFRVFAAHEPDKRYEVAVNADAPSCTCPDFRQHTHTPGYSCAHVRAVLQVTGKPSNGESASSKTQGHPLPLALPTYSGNVMMLKRSVSPDGRIDSLSVQFACPLENGDCERAVEIACDTLALQNAIVAHFLGREDAPKGNDATAFGNGNQAVAGQMIDIGGMQTRFGWRYFINVKVNGDLLKLFGTSQQLREQLAQAGYSGLAENIAKGVELNVPCRVITKPSDDGKYINIEQVLPPQAVTSGRGAAK